MAEGRLGTRQVEFPHAAEPLIIEFRDALTVFIKTVPPSLQRFCVVQPQHLDVRYIEARLLNRRQDLGKRGNVCAGEDVFVDPGICSTRTIGAADRVDQCDTVVFKEISDLKYSR